MSDKYQFFDTFEAGEQAPEWMGFAAFGTEQKELRPFLMGINTLYIRKDFAQKLLAALNEQDQLRAEVERLREALEIEGDNTQSWKNLFRQKDKAWQEEHTERIRLEERLKHAEGVLERLREMDNDALQGGEG